MAFAGARNQVVAEINITPLVDVMLVLLIIFMVAAPILGRPIPLELPQPGPEAKPPASTLRLDLAADGRLAWNGAGIESRMLEVLLRAEAARAEPVLLELAVAPEADYRRMAQLLAQARNAGLTRIGIVAAD